MNADTINRDMIEWAAASVDRAARILTKALARVTRIDPDDLVTEMIGAPASARQLTDALSQLAALGQEAADLLEMLP